MSSPHYRIQRTDAIGIALVAVAQAAIFFNRPRHFFTGDSLFWMGRRHHSIGEFFAGFVTLDPGAWYRPLTQRALLSALFPFAGLNPVPYRILGFLLFFGCTVGVFLLTQRITESRRAAWFATLFFAPHVTHAFVTYDIAYTPELVFTLFSIGSAIYYLGYLRTGRLRALTLSVVLFVGGLLSKETAVALPFALLALWWFAPGEKHRSLRSLVPHVVILGLYLVFVIGYIHVREIRLSQLISAPGHAGQPGYELVLGNNIFQSLDIALTWSFGIPRGTHGQWMFALPSTLLLLKVLRLAICVAAVFVLFTPRRNLLLVGIGWFLAMLAPTLPLLDHFLPYYIFAPLVGFSLAVGVVFDWICETCARGWPVFATGLVALLLASYAATQASAATRFAAGHILLGGSAATARNSMIDLEASYPRLPRGTDVIILDEERPILYWELGNGALIGLAYDDPSLRTSYTTEPPGVSVERARGRETLVFKWTDGHLTDMTSLIHQRPDLLDAYAPRVIYHLELSATEVRAGKGSYTMRIPELPGATVEVLYAVDGVIKEPVHAQLGADGSIKFDVGGETKTGRYTFVALRRAGEASWFVTNKSITVR